MRIAFIGNCQVESFAVAAQHMLDDAEISIFDYSQDYSRNEAARRRYVLGLHSTDYVFAQTATFSHTSEHDLRDVLGDRLVTIANFYFRGLFPDTCYIGDFHNRLDTPSTLHSVIVLDGFRRGFSEEAVCRRFNSATLDAFGVGDAWSSSMAEMRAREAGGVLDVPLGDLMEEACRRYPAFLTMNHPSGRLITEYLAKVLDHVGIRHRVPQGGTYPDALSRHDMVPIHDFVAERYRLAYRTPQNWKVNSLGGATTREDYVASCYQAYAGLDVNSLTIHSPTDMVAALRNSAYVHLVDPEGAASSHNPRLPDLASRSRERRLAGELANAVQPAETSLGEVATYVHKVHSLTETMAPKVEHVVHRLTLMEDAERRADAAHRAAANADVAVHEAMRAGIDGLRHRVDGLQRLVRLGVGLTVLAIAIELGLRMLAP